ncbi:hypothetical protein O6H91_17G090300 [Diphasiastrum complanatum]|uniref:Uncharacterized protein n=1 Tax=Diphasiastrum complanatum TaxID=34168 RepID=A0ACC2B958_DIPCM|nr:hypothetical protein O6H91_17G090300 [Diphasiastrum complanatum]
MLVVLWLIMVADALSLPPADHLRQQQQLTSESKHEKRSDHGGVPPVPVPSNKSDEPIVRKPRNREITSRYKLVSQTSHRCSSPDFGRSSHPLELPKRAMSADRRHPTTPLNSDTTSSILLPKSGRKVSKQLWPPDNISASKQMNCTLNGWREENILLKDVNGVQGSTCQNDVSQENAMEPLVVRCSGADQAENLRPIGNFHEKRDASWADIGSNSKRGSYAVSRSLDFYAERQRSGGDNKSAIRLNNSSSRNASAKLLARSRNDFSHHVQHSSTSENKVISIPDPQNCDIAKPSGAVDNPESAKGEDFGHLRLLSDEGEMTSSEPSVSSDFEASGLLVGLSVRGAKVRDNKATMRGTIVPARFWQELGSRMRRFSEGECTGASASESDNLKGSRRTKATFTGSAAAASPPLSPSTLSKSTQFVSSLKELPNLPKTRVSQNGRHMSQSITSSAVLDGRKGRKNLNQQEEAHYLRILQNRLLQWRFVNAQAEFANSSQQAAAESMLCNSWLQTSDLRMSVIEKRIKLQQSRLSMKIESIFSSHVKTSLKLTMFTIYQLE